MGRRLSVGMVLFDLDGTLADTAPDMAAALNRLRAEEGREALPFECIRPMVSLGSPAMIKLGFDCEPGVDGYDSLRERWLAFYHGDLASRTTLFPGVESVLEALARRGLPWGIVTNKPGWLTTPLLEALGMAGRALCVVSGDTLARRKPHPDQLLHACGVGGVAPGRCVYVGDTAKDILAGRNARMHTLAATYGYVPPGEDPGRWGADGSIEAPEELLAWLGLER